MALPYTLTGPGTTFKDFISGIINVLNDIVVPLIFTLAFAVFVWGVVNYFFLSAGNENKREQGKQFVLWGIIGMVVMFGVWGLVYILLFTFGLG